MKVVIIDDHWPVLEMMEGMLEDIEGVHICTFNQIEEAYAYIIHHEVDVILTDICMPSMDGIELCRKLKTYEHLANVPILMITGLDDEKKLAEAFAAGAFDYIRKPFTMVELIARVQLAYRQKRMVDELKNAKNTYMESYRRLLMLQKKVEEDLQLARSVQERLLPKSVCNQHICFRGKYIPSSQLSGDLYFWQQVSNYKYAFIVLDVMGHGVASALIGMSIRSLLHGLMVRVTDPLLVVHELNRHAFRLFVNESKHYFTAFYGVIDVEQKEMEYVNAGHPPALLVNNNSTFTLKEGGIPIGLVEQFPYKKGKVSFHEDARLALYTDGLIDAWGDCCAEQMVHMMKTIQTFHSFVDEVDKKMTESHGNDDMTFVAVHIK